MDRQDHDDTQSIVCPLHDCNHIWCKTCQQTIVVGGPKHSCDGSSELDHLMKEKGWRYCPSACPPDLPHFSDNRAILDCKTPILKESGCNHMTVSLLVLLSCGLAVLTSVGGFFISAFLRDATPTFVTSVEA